MKTLLIACTLLLASQTAYAHCPIAIEVKSQKYCAMLEWQEAELNGVPADKKSPYLVPMLDTSQAITPDVFNQRLQSNLRIHIWFAEDTTHQPQKIEGLRVFPYMLMASGAHHSTAHQELTWSDTHQAYELKNMVFQHMNGCWHLRWSILPQDTSGTLLSTISEYSNISLEESSDIEQLCQVLVDDFEAQTIGDSDHHHHHRHH